MMALFMPDNSNAVHSYPCNSFDDKTICCNEALGCCWVSSGEMFALYDFLRDGVVGDEIEFEHVKVVLAEDSWYCSASRKISR